jgi:hypothetical protein
VDQGRNRIGGFGGGGGGHDGGYFGQGGFGGGNGAASDHIFGTAARGGGGAGLGGAIFNRGGTVIVVNSTLTNNRAHGGDGAVNVSGSQDPSGAGSAFGGAIFNLNGTVRLTNATVARNHLDGGSGYGGRTDGYQVYNLAYSLDGQSVTARMTLANTILAGAPGDRHDLVNQLSTPAPNNRALVENANADVHAPTNIISTPIANLDGSFEDGVGGPTRGLVNVLYAQVRPLLKDLGNNGGWTWTMALEGNSPARNAGLRSLAVRDNGDPLTHDQRGPSFARALGSSIDLGAFEFGAGGRG